jgi:hypothetical protein
MKAFSVWIRRLGDACRVRVDGLDNAKWLLGRLSDSFVFKTSEPMNEDTNSACCTFRVAYSSQMSHRRFEMLLAAIPGVQVMPDLA